MSDVVRALFSSCISETMTIHEGELFAADDPLVAQHPDWFSDDLLAVATRTGLPVVAKKKYRTADEKVDV